MKEETKQIVESIKKIVKTLDTDIIAISEEQYYQNISKYREVYAADLDS